jgi:hypothetical protein
MRHEKLRVCGDCDAKPGSPHESGCDVERCSVCGCQWIGCGCEGHDPLFARWTGLWPGSAEANEMGIDLNDMWMYRKQFFIKPGGDSETDTEEA